MGIDLRILFLVSVAVTIFLFIIYEILSGGRFPPGFLQLIVGFFLVIAMAATLIQLAGVFQVFDGMQVVAAGVLRGLGDTVTPMLAQFVGFWILGVPLGVVLIFRTEIGAPGPWWGLVVGLAVAASLLLLRVAVLLRRAPRRVDLDQ